MDSATILAIIILVVAILILIYYYLQSTNNPVYQNIHAQATGLTNRVSQEEYIVNLTEKVNDLSEVVKEKVQTEEDRDGEHVSKTDLMSKKIDQFINEQSEQVINDWNLVTHDDVDTLVKRVDALNEDFVSYKEDNDNRVLNLEKRVDNIDKELKKINKK